MEPDFICIGLQKAATRWLHEQLRHASTVWMPPIKEINYFSNNSFKPANLRILQSRLLKLRDLSLKHYVRDANFYHSFQRGIAPESYTDQWYFSLFSHKDQYISGDVSPSYSGLDDDDVARIARLLPNTRMILLLRHPVARAKSALSMRIRSKFLGEEDIQSVQRLREIVSKNNMARLSFPSEIWCRWVGYFGADRCRYYFMEDVISDPERTRRQVAEFVGAGDPKFGMRANANRKSRNKRYAFPLECEEFLYEYFKEEILRCREVFQGHALNWKTAL